MTETATHVPWRIEDCVAPLDSQLEPSLSRDDFDLIARDREWQDIERARCQVDPWYWRVNYVVTLNEHWVEEGWQMPYRRWPATEHSRSYCHVLFTERRTAWPKSRQQMMTWLVATQMLGDAMFTGGRLYMIQSKREKDAQAVLLRAKGVYDRMYAMCPWLVPELHKPGSASELRWANDSCMMAVPEGATYVQSRTPTWWMADELQLQAQGETALTAALAACWRVSLIATPEYGWFWQIFLRDKAAEAA